MKKEGRRIRGVVRTDRGERTRGKEGGTEVVGDGGERERERARLI